MFNPSRQTGFDVPLIRTLLRLVLALMAAEFTAALASAVDWPQFRGPGAMGSSAVKGVPTEWADDKNIVWKTALPGPGASSPITLGNRIFLTCFTGFATSSREPGAMTHLKRHLLCLSAEDGKVVWNTP